MIFRYWAWISLATALVGCGSSSDSVRPQANLPPTVEVGNDQTVTAGQTVNLSGSASDPDGQISTYAWLQTEGVEVALTGADQPSATFVAPAINAANSPAMTLVFKLIVTDNNGANAQASTQITIEPKNPLPNALNIKAVHVAGGQFAKPVINGSLAYIAQGGTLSVWDLADPKQSQLLFTSENAVSDGLITAIAQQGNRLYGLWTNPINAGKLVVFSLENPRAPQFIEALDYAPDASFHVPSGLIAVGQIMLIGDDDNGLFSFDTSEPSPIITQGSQIPDGFANLLLRDNTLIASGKNRLGQSTLSFYDVLDPSAPGLLNQTSFFSFGLALAKEIAVGFGNQFSLLDISDFNQPSTLFSAPSDVTLDAIINQQHVYLNGPRGMLIVDISQPSAPKLTRSAKLPIEFALKHVNTDFGTLILTKDDRGLMVDTLSDPANPSLLSEFQLKGGSAPTDIAFVGQQAFIAQQNFGLSVVNVNDLTTLARFDAQLKPEAQNRVFEAIAIKDNVAYLASWGAGLIVVDISNASAPKQLAILPLPFISSIAIEGNIAYVGTSTTSSLTNGFIMASIDISNPVKPQIISTQNTAKVTDLVVQDQKAYLAGNSLLGETGGLSIFDVSEPSQPLLLGQYSQCEFASGVVVVEQTAYLSCFDSSLHLLNIQDPEAIELLGTYHTADDANSGWSVAVSGDLAYLGHILGVDEIDITHPAQPKFIKRLTTAWTARQLRWSPNGRLFVATTLGGVYVFDK